MKRTSLIMFVGAICLALGGQWFAVGQMSGQYLEAVIQQKADRQRLLDEMIERAKPWTPPTGPSPAWLDRGKQHFQSIEQIRDVLGRLVKEQDIQQLPLSQVLARISNDLEIPINFDEQEISGQDLTTSTPVSLQFVGNARSFLNLLLEPLSLAYTIREGGIVITSMEKASSRPSLAVYDISYITEGNSSLKSIVSTIDAIVDIDRHDVREPVARVILIDHLLAIFATERQHIEIESFLARLAPIDAATNEKSVSGQTPKPENPPPADPFSF